MSDTHAANEVILYTDGACSGNPGPGGWAYILRHPASGKVKRDSGGEPETTNNRMEMQAAIEGLSALKGPCKVTLVTDSKYVAEGLKLWLPGWKKRGWKRADNGPVKNVDLWQKLDALNERHTITTEVIRGHAGHPENEECDRMAVEACKLQKMG